MQQEPLAADQVQRVLRDAATGRVRCARQLHAGAVLRHQRRIGCVAFLIAFVTNLIPGLWYVSTYTCRVDCQLHSLGDGLFLSASSTFTSVGRGDLDDSMVVR